MDVDEVFELYSVGVRGLVYGQLHGVDVPEYFPNI